LLTRRSFLRAFAAAGVFSLFLLAALGCGRIGERAHIVLRI
jgi:hypothetical protein